MKEFINYSGILLILTGVVILVIYSLLTQPSNAFLVVAPVLMGIGLVGQIFLLRRK
jgi:hypothetical protein